MSMPVPEYVEYDYLREVADEFLGRHWGEKIPVDIEHIVDVELGLDIVPVRHLYRGYGIDGYLSADRSAIYVDEAAYDHTVLYHYRFTLAHEVAHLVLHRDLFDAAEFGSIEDWKRFLGEMPEWARSRYEWQGYNLGGLLLVQEEPLDRHISSAVEMARKKSFDEIDLREEAHRDYIAEYVGRRFDVSQDVILKRGAKDGHW